MPGGDSCTSGPLDANLVGIGGLQEPRKVAVFVSTDVHDDKKAPSKIGLYVSRERHGRLPGI
jgi:hypothetical protein